MSQALAEINPPVRAARPRFMDGLNPAQRAAVGCVEGPLLIAACAGSGKTKVIAHRIAHLIDGCGVGPDEILAVTFTNKAAGEMKGRVIRLLDADESDRQPWVSTFHSLCLSLLRADVDRLGHGYTRSFTVCDQEDGERLIRKCMRELQLSSREVTPRALQGVISGAKNRGQSARAFAISPPRDRVPAQAAEVFRLYEQRLREANALDFDDLLLYAVELLETSDEARRWYHARFRHVMVDEMQDTSAVQYALIRLLAEGEPVGDDKNRRRLDWQGRSLCVVGDIDQAVYRFRCADYKLMLGFRRDFPAARVIRLAENYRSTAEIVAAAAAVIRHNRRRIEGPLRSAVGPGAKVRVARLATGEDEARFVARALSRHLRRDPQTRAAVRKVDTLLAHLADCSNKSLPYLLCRKPPVKNIPYVPVRTNSGPKYRRCWIPGEAFFSCFRLPDDPDSSGSRSHNGSNKVCCRL
jgi:DNA helicase II / ATP-dependent DNA helicase PcrA